MRMRTLMGALITAVILVWSAGSAGAATRPTPLPKLARQQTALMLKYYEGQNVSPSACGQGQGPKGIHGVFLLPVPSFTPGDQTVNCQTTARSVLVDLGGVVITEDNRFPDSSWTLKSGEIVPFTRENLEPICEDFTAQGLLGSPARTFLDGNRPITGPALDSGVFTARINRHAQIPGGADLYADSVGVGHPGRLATVFCGFKAKVKLRPGQHTIVADYTAFFPASTVITYNLTVKDGKHCH